EKKCDEQIEAGNKGLAEIKEAKLGLETQMKDMENEAGENPTPDQLAAYTEVNNQHAMLSQMEDRMQQDTDNYTQLKLQAQNDQKPFLDTQKELSDLQQSSVKDAVSSGNQAVLGTPEPKPEVKPESEIEQTAEPKPTKQSEHDATTEIPKLTKSEPEPLNLATPRP